ncbi:MAG TPA: RNA polymerase factor sigma-32 [Polyangiaceae bacterium]|nr:RNA polymerase factor sigma-32 [Polyangiaceae bacterium]
MASRKSSTKKTRPKKAPVDTEAEKADERDPDDDEAPEGDGEDAEREPADEDVESAETEGDVEVIDDSELEKIAVPRGGSKGAIARADPLSVYMSEVQRHKLLTSEQEHSLAVDYTKTGNVDAAARLVTSNLRLVVKIAYEYRRAYRNIMDLIQEGNIGLMQAVKRYDPYRGVKLSSYAAWWIRAYMLRFILNNWRLVKIGTTQAQRRLFFNLNKEKARLTAMGIEPTHSTIATNLRVDEKDVVEMDRRLARGDASLDAPVGDAEGRQTTRMELLASTSSDPEETVESTELSELVRGRLDEFRKTLVGKELQIFDDRLVAEDPMTLQELGDRFGVSRERVRQLEARLTGKLRTYLKSELGDAVEVGT